MVVTSWPSTSAARMLHDFTVSPFSITVHAPQLPVPHPMCVPVRRSTSRSMSARIIRVSTSMLCGFLFTVTLTGTFMAFPLSLVSADPAHGRAHRALCVHLRHRASVVGVSVQVSVRVDGGLRGVLPDALHRGVVEAALEARRDVDEDGLRPDARQPDPHGLEPLLDHGGRGDDGEVPLDAVEPQIRRAGAA